MKRAIIVHCWEGVPQYCWYPWLKKELESEGYQVEVPAMPETELPKEALWVPRLSEIIGEPDEELIVIGHSVGVITILRYLESLPEGVRIGGSVLVAGFTDNLGFNELSNFFESEINFAEIKSHCNSFIAIHSDNDPFVDLKHAEILKNNLGAKVIIKEKMGHFSGAIDGEESCTELPEVKDAVLSFDQ